MLWLLSGPPGFTCWISFAPLFSLSLSLLYLLFISWFIYFCRWCIEKLGVFHVNQTSMCRRETGLCPPVEYLYWPFQGGTSFVDRLCFLCLVFLMLSRLFIAALWSPPGKGLISWLLLVMFIVFLLLSQVVSWVRCGIWLYRFTYIFLFGLTPWSASEQAWATVFYVQYTLFSLPYWTIIKSFLNDRDQPKFIFPPFNNDQIHFVGPNIFQLNFEFEF